MLDLILPSTTFLEEWGYDHSPPGSGFAEVKINSLSWRLVAAARSVVDILFQISKKLNAGVASSFANMGDSSEGICQIPDGRSYPLETNFSRKEFGRGETTNTINTPDLSDAFRKFEFSSGNLKTLVARTKQGKKRVWTIYPDPARQNS